ncbi:hypothetical protein PHJA_002340400 [Phtheirospermum japonicum]|uniref:Uncharacterized protein n=1 Tax=Phtheirospermum japonicum TaxID=374723 RepID=A0A830D0M2_9LAMI|nr:hypothetical protein PHJA_002340400 [Phtheirospermum japonicum]
MGLGGISHPVMRLKSLIEARDLYPSPFREEYDCTAVKEDKIAVLIGSIADDIHLQDEVPGIKFTSSQR